jgi:ankyrin repeat protein
LLATSKRGHCDVVICLLNSGADINLRDRDGQSPFLAAVKRGYCDVYDYLRSSGADTH